MATIYLFRHGQTHYNKGRIFTGWKDSTLTPTGIKQAKQLSLLLKDKKIDIAYHSRLSRSKDTLRQVLKSHPECKQIYKDDRIIERNYGKLSGFAHQTIINEFGQKQFDKWHRSWDERPPQGESFADVALRVGDFIKDLKSKYSGKNVSIVVSAHGNSIRAFRKIMEKSTESEASSWKIPYDQYFEYKI
ncbi:hypothetical protein A2574_01880 [Candidatus Shapirobacteria bacterium RIFOXYD1_FULL_38_32]|uniref:2,3-bisphosphoglycerate-dependent phosphoglycerate mutase n=4 Tax=Patescibacteria group TaxID=1783273 RepID=A0A0G0MD91_9BACT|nr:MAG: 2,3-bisphosphoglycerate-dependent phosphoglycerate mutase [Candidatus Shapirobacteria bacterium GW2011_GWE2_38_30]OGJ06059.1 MAG: hypothetical protein A2192_02675 [Candidatus Nomurabacteria bacterium RIFOXYA1_FULL_35_17]OGL57762.1 MAG: hypothetical protein A2574_01880 [Candidatus Shapirobacteria bacterium RIFOXYD1_FULL_38_32]HCU55546.1 hypothetical protein [Candidatus Shapirobacteria bacterium]